ncbi:Hhe domain protein [Mycena kentingensis (nom. inval.)]|nr:Hhe domain protein [Mycena kentingensis (nom. inval.)]
MANGTRSIQTLSQVIQADHQEVIKFYEQYQNAAGDMDAQARWARQLTWELARHSIAEEIVVYPLMEKLLGDVGKKLAAHDREEHQAVKELIGPMMMDLMHHIEGEENNDLPQLEAELDYRNDQSTHEVVSDFLRTKQFVPTRSHPSAPARPPFETLAGLLAAPMDKLKDAFAKFPTEEMEEGARSGM